MLSIEFSGFGDGFTPWVFSSNILITVTVTVIDDSINNTDACRKVVHAEEKQ